MKEDKEKLEQEKHEKPMSLLMMSVITGLFGGIFWSGIGYLAYLLNFTKIHPRVIIEPWTIGDWKHGWLGTVISIVLIGIISIGVALLYYLLLRKFARMYIGMAVGLVLFLLVFLVLNPIFPGIDPLTKLDRNTIITSICLYVLFGVFVGYSISYEANEIRKLKESKQDESSTI
jgi:hypothetical protein